MAVAIQSSRGWSGHNLKEDWMSRDAFGEGKKSVAGDVGALLDHYIFHLGADSIYFAHNSKASNGCLHPTQSNPTGWSYPLFPGHYRYKYMSTPLYAPLSRPARLPSPFLHFFFIFPLRG